MPLQLLAGPSCGNFHMRHKQTDNLDLVLHVVLISYTCKDGGDTIANCSVYGRTYEQLKRHDLVFKYPKTLRVFHVGSTVAAGPAEDGLFCERAKRVPTYWR